MDFLSNGHTLAFAEQTADEPYPLNHDPELGEDFDSALPQQALSRCDVEENFALPSNSRLYIGDSLRDTNC
ncbi:uncharacterized protein TrAtP1_001436 [Trichoderma atroviride]|uniref:uncharacterized protein n=1 Tax=Hypocrea atroviridis TaxID=63577 RepID=UPI003328702D|nr:hypothetical protein TrAtP1_001436 [Trichoderma atroviride]